MSVLRRAWRVLADPPTSTAATYLRVLIPLHAALAVARSLPVWPFDRPSGSYWSHFALYFVFLCVTLYFVRQRDEARADIGQTERSARL